MKKIKLQSKLSLAKTTIATLSAANQAQVQGGTGLTPCLGNSDTGAPMSKLNCVSYFYKCGWVSWVNCSALGCGGGVAMLANNNDA